MNLGAHQGDEGLVDEVLGWIGWQNYLCFGFDVDFFDRRCFDYCFDCRSYYHRGHHDYFGLLGPCPLLRLRPEDSRKTMALLKEEVAQEEADVVASRNIDMCIVTNYFNVIV